MATKLYDPPLVTAEAFLAMDFGEHKAELDNGVIRMMAGGTARHARVQVNIVTALMQKLRGTGCAPYGSDMAVKTRAMSVRYPDVSVHCGRTEADDQAKAFDDPRVIFEVLSAGTARTDLRIKLDEYRRISSLDTIIFVDIASDTLRIVQRTGPTGWTDESFVAAITARLPSLGVELTHEEIFARD